MFKMWLEAEEAQNPPQDPQKPSWKSFQAGQQREFGFQREGPWARKPDDWVPEAERPSNWEEQKLNVYHVTTNLAGVKQTFALKSRRQLGNKSSGLGGGWKNEASDMISTTYNYDKASSIYQALQYMCSIVRNEVPASKILETIMDQFGIYGWDENEALHAALRNWVPGKYLKDQYADQLDAQLDKRIKTAEQKYDFYIAIEDALGTQDDDNWSGDYYPPNRIGFTSSFQSMAALQHNQIAILQLAVRKGAESEHVPQEEEIRFSPEDLRVVRYLQP
jgi:hypothetical protein